MSNEENNVEGAGRGKWGSHWGFILAAAGSAVGLGNIWKFPYITGENGGGLFVLIYLACILFVGLPIMVAEIMIGRAARQQPVAAFKKLQGGNTAWSAVGWLGVAAGFIILSYYCVVAGWAMDYTLKSITNFTSGPAKAARVESLVYRATASQDDMKELLSDHDVELDDDFRKWETREKLPLSGNSWNEKALYDRALTEAVTSTPEWRALAKLTSHPIKVTDEETLSAKDIVDSVGDQAQKREVAAALERAVVARADIERLMLEDEELAQLVSSATAIEKSIKDERIRVKAEHKKHYDDASSYTEKKIRDKAEAQKRRNGLAQRIGQKFTNLATDGWTSTFWVLLFMSIVIVIVAGGISGGIERTCRILMPVLMVLIGLMVLYGMTQPGFGRAVSFVFTPDRSALHTGGVLEALGHAFFTLSLGMGAMITYGSYQEDKSALVFQSVWITIFDTLIALAACLMIFPITYSFGLAPGSGPGLVFVSMPLAFSEMGAGGLLVGIVFFGLLVFAALTSAISMLEVCCSYLIDAKGWTRPRAAVTVGTLITSVGIIVAFSSDPDFLLRSWLPGFDKNFFDTWDYLASNWLLPLGGLFTALYAGWVMPRRYRDAELEGLSSTLVGGWLILVRIVAPFLVILVLAQKAGLIDV